MLKIENLVGKTDEELKDILKRVIFDKTEEIDWIEIFEKFIEEKTLHERINTEDLEFLEPLDKLGTKMYGLFQNIYFDIEPDDDDQECYDIKESIRKEWKKGSFFRHSIFKINNPMYGRSKEELEEVFENVDRKITIKIEKSKLNIILSYTAHLFNEDYYKYEINEYYSIIKDRDRFNEMLEIIFKIIKRVLYSYYEASLDELTDFFSGGSSKESVNMDDINIENKLI